MKKTIDLLRVTAILGTLSIFLWSGDCNGRPSNVGYHYVEMYRLHDLDFLKMLDDKDNAKVYNALCNLTEQARNMNKYLLEDSFKGRPERDTSLMLHSKFTKLLTSDDPWVSSAAIRLLGEVDYEHDAYIDRLLRDNRPERNIQLEICAQIKQASHKDQRLLRAKIQFLRSQKDWLMHHSAYQISNRDDSCASDIFLDDFQHAQDPDTREMAFWALADHVDRQTFPIMTRAYDSVQIKVLKTSICLSLLCYTEGTYTQDWFFSKPELLDSLMNDVIELVLQNNPGQKENPDLSGFIIRALQTGWRPAKSVVDSPYALYPGEPTLYRELLQCKYNTLDKPDSLTITKAGRTVENALLGDPELRKEWLDYQARMKPRSLPASLLKEQTDLTDAYLSRCRILILRETRDTALAKVYETDIRRVSDEFRKKSTPRRPGEYY